MTLAILAAMVAVHGGGSSALSVPNFLTQDGKKPEAVKTEDKQEKKDEKKEDDPYTKAIKDYTADDGVFKVWRQKESIMYEIPKSMMGRDFIWITEIKQTPAGMYNGTAVGEAVVRWEERDDKVLLRLMDYSVTASNGDDAIQEAVRQSNVNPIMRAFDIKAHGKDGSTLVDVSSFLKNDIPEVSVRGALGGAGQDSSRSFIEKVKSFPNNVNAYVWMTFMPGGGGGGFFGGPSGSGPRTALISHSMSLLPEKPMRGRIKDSRVGYFSTGVTDYGTADHGTKTYEFISRYRLEKKDPSAELSEPVKPIVYYLSREVPAKWRPYLKKGVEDWQPAFEAAGFKNAIICKDAPSEKEDPDWSPEDSRYSVIRWAPLPIENAMGPSTVDPRSGEILSAHIIVWHDVLKLADDWYFSQASASDSRARRFPFPDDLTGDLMEFIVAHEVGHTLGLPHNGKSSAMIPVRLLRDPKWTKENGTCTSIMDYARFNYVAQPGDGAALIPKVGRYDKFAIKWGYTPISAGTMWDEKPVLDSWASAQATDPMLRFYDNFNGADPTAQSEALGDNAVEASNYGIQNLKRMMTWVKPASVRLGEDYSDLARLHTAISTEFIMFVLHVSAVVGGVEQIDWHGGRGNAVYNPVSPSYQRSAVNWLIDNALNPPTWLTPADITTKLGPDVGLNRLGQMQAIGVAGLLNDARLARMITNEATGGYGVFTVSQMFAMVRNNAWKELSSAKPTIPLVRRNLQRAWVNGLTRKLGTSSEVRALAMAELETERDSIAAAIPKTRDSVSLAHLKELRKQIQFCLDNPDKANPGAGAAPVGRFGLDGSKQLDPCFPTLFDIGQ